MFKWTYDFYKRHRRKIFITGIIAGGTYAAAKYISWKISEWGELKAIEFSSEAKKQFHFESNQRTCTMTFISFLPNIRDVIVDKLNTEKLLEVLKMKPANKLEIWEELKVLSLSRVVCSILSNVALLVFLKVELNIIGGYMFVHSSQQLDKMDSDVELSDVQVMYLNNVRYFIENQLPSLVDDIASLVKGMLKSVFVFLGVQCSKLCAF